MTNVREIIINSKEHGRHVVFIDEDDFSRVSKLTWRINKNYPTRTYAITNLKELNYKPVKMHRLIMGFPNHQIDHRDGNGLNNTKSNLRKCNDSQNQANRPNLNKNNTVGFKGVQCRPNRKKKYSASIKFNYKNIHLGYFYLVVDAAKAYNEAAIKYFGEFACLNKI